MQVIEVGDRLNQSQPVFTAADIAFEKRDETFACAVGFRQVVHEAFQRAVVVVDQLASAVWAGL